MRGHNVLEHQQKILNCDSLQVILKALLQSQGLRIQIQLRLESQVEVQVVDPGSVIFRTVKELKYEGKLIPTILPTCANCTGHSVAHFFP